MQTLSLRILFVLGFFCSLAPSAISQDNFEGSIVFSITYRDLPPDLEGMKPMLPTISTMYLKGDRTVMVQDGISGKTSIVSDRANKSSFVMMDMMGQKMVIKSTPEDYAKEEAKKASQTIDYLEGTKEVAGYTCNKAQVTAEGQPPMTVYYTTEIPVSAGFQFSSGLKGFPLYYETQQNGITLVMTATKITKEIVADSLFEIPEGYKIMTSEEMDLMKGY